MLRLFTTTDFTGHWPVGVSAVIVARDHAQAVEVMSAALLKEGLEPRQSFTMKEIDLSTAQAHILQNGDY